MYKILIQELNKHYTVDFKGLCKMKKIAPKLGFYKRSIRAKQSDRMSNAYPSFYEVAKWLNVKHWPSGRSTWDDFETVSSSWDSTMKYIETMYGKEYAKGFERASYPELRKAA